MRKRQSAASPDSVLAELLSWEADLRPGDLVGRVQDLTALDYWEATRSVGTRPDPQKPSPYGQAAREILGQQEVMQALADWFDSGRARSAFNLGVALGEADRGDAVAATAAAWLEAGRCAAVVVGYLRGVASRHGTLPSVWGEGLDRGAQAHPEYAGLLTLDCDFSRAGFQRVMRLLALGALPTNCLSAFASPNWESHLGVEERVELLEFLLRFQEPDRQQVLATALYLGASWTHYGSVPLPPELAGPVLQVLRASLDVRVDVGAWTSLLESLAPTHAEETADLVTDALTSGSPLRVVLEDLTLAVLLDLAKRHPRLVMDALGRRLLDPERRLFFGLLRFRGLFEAIGLPEVRRWVSEHGAEPVRYIARHLENPCLQAGELFIPPVTEWVMAEYGADERVFREFCMGRHAFEIQEGHARDRRAGLEQAMGPFLQHRLPWVRRWAEYELAENVREAEIDDHMDDRVERM
jgi:hypothetical protein